MEANRLRSRFALQLITIAAALLCVMRASAAIRPSFSLEDCAWPATDIVIAAQGHAPGDALTVIETWRGDLKPGDAIEIAELPVAPIPVSTEFDFDKKLPVKFVSGSPPARDTVIKLRDVLAPLPVFNEPDAINGAVANCDRIIAATGGPEGHSQ
jgi:hypothetical protein